MCVEGGHRRKSDQGLAFSGLAVDINDEVLEGVSWGWGKGEICFFLTWFPSETELPSLDEHTV